MRMELGEETKWVALLRGEERNAQFVGPVDNDGLR